MSQPNHEITIREPWDYQGRNPIRAIGDGIVHGSDGDYYLLTIASPLIPKEAKTRQLVVSPRYKDVTLDQVMKKKGTVGIGAVKTGNRLITGESFDHSQIIYFAIGEIRRV